MQTVIGAGEFKAKCLQLIDDVATQRSTLVITKYGKPVAKLVPVESEQKLFGALKDSVVSSSDLITSIDVDWEATR